MRNVIILWAGATAIAAAVAASCSVPRLASLEQCGKGIDVVVGDRLGKRVWKVRDGDVVCYVVSNAGISCVVMKEGKKEAERGKDE